MVGVQKVHQKVLYFIRCICNPMAFICVYQSSWMWAELWNPLLTPVRAGAQQPLGVFGLHVLAGSPAPIVSRAYQSLGCFHVPPSEPYFFFLCPFPFFFLKLFLHQNLRIPIESIHANSHGWDFHEKMFGCSSWLPFCLACWLRWEQSQKYWAIEPRHSELALLGCRFFPS